MKNFNSAELIIGGLFLLALASFLFFKGVCFIQDLKAKGNGKNA